MLDSKIVGGLVVDGTGEEPYRADVGIKDGKIVEIREYCDSALTEKVLGKYPARGTA